MKYLILLIALICNTSYADKIKIGIIDTGINLKAPAAKFMCKSGHKSMIKNQDISDNHGHGTNIASLITKNLDPKKYCIVIVKFYDSKVPNLNTANTSVKAFKYLVDKIEPLYINYSAGGNNPDHSEKRIIIKGIKKGIKFALASGNYGNKTSCNYYPACYNLDKQLVHVVSNSSKSANDNKYVTHYDIFCGGVPNFCGTSQSTASHLNKWILNDNR